MLHCVYYSMRNIILCFIVSLLPISAGEWVSLFDGKTLNGWTKQADVNWHIADNAITASEGKVSLLISEKTYENYELKLEFKAAIGTNSGVFLNSEAVVKDEAIDCYEVNIAPQTNGFPTGSIVQHNKIMGKGEKNEWRSYHLTVNQGVVTVILDGEKLMTYKVEKPRPAGYIGLQKNAGKIQFRNIQIKTL